MNLQFFARCLSVCLIAGLWGCSSENADGQEPAGLGAAGAEADPTAATGGMSGTDPTAPGAAGQTMAPGGAGADGAMPDSAGGAAGGGAPGLGDGGDSAGGESTSEGGAGGASGGAGGMPPEGMANPERLWLNGPDGMEVLSPIEPKGPF